MLQNSKIIIQILFQQYFLKIKKDTTFHPIARSEL
jgi:hypothetical protein